MALNSPARNQILWGSQVERQLVVTQPIAGSNPAPTAKIAGVAFWWRAPAQQAGEVEFDSLPRHHAFEAHQDEQAALTRQAVGSIPTGRTKFRDRG